jgi:predicted RNA-binding protein YlxR (DUF448 family)
MPETKTAAPIVTTPGRRASVRTCIGCRRAAPASELVRVVLVDGQPVVDARRALPGRGASLHPSEACVRAALSHQAFGRAFRCRVVVAAPDELSVQVSSRVTAALGGLRDRNGTSE